jgi:hypothetical protein
LRIPSHVFSVSSVFERIIEQNKNVIEQTQAKLRSDAMKEAN